MIKYPDGSYDNEAYVPDDISYDYSSSFRKKMKIPDITTDGAPKPGYPNNRQQINNGIDEFIFE